MQTNYHKPAFAASTESQRHNNTTSGNVSLHIVNFRNHSWDRQATTIPKTNTINIHHQSYEKSLHTALANNLLAATPARAPLVLARSSSLQLSHTTQNLSHTGCPSPSSYSSSTVSTAEHLSFQLQLQAQQHDTASCFSLQQLQQHASATRTLACSRCSSTALG